MAFRVSICGGGLGGLALALVIGHHGDLPVDVFEAGPTITTVGAGISFYGRGMAIIKEMGLYDELVQVAIGPPKENDGPYFRKADQRDGYAWFAKHLKHGVMNLHRKDVVDVFLRHMPASCRIHTSKKLTSYEVIAGTGEIMLHFYDGSSAVTDVLVGADGIHSATRKIMYQKLATEVHDRDAKKRLLACIDPAWTGILVYRNLIPIAKLAKEYRDPEPPADLTVHVGKHKHMVTYPISQQLMNVVIFLHNRGTFGAPFKENWVMDVSGEEVKDQFDDWDDRSRAIVKVIERPSRWALHSLLPLPHYVDDRVALLGDAAHAMEPHFGSGAGQAIEDAYVLGRLLTHPLTHAGNVAEALETYEHVRLPFVNDLVRRTRAVGRYYSFSDVFESVSDGDTPEELDRVRRSIEDAWEWQNESEWVWSEAEERWRAKCHTQGEP